MRLCARILLSSLPLGLVCVAGLGAQEPAPSPTPAPSAPAAESVPVFPTQVELITVDVVVTDKEGQPVTDLTPDDFVVKEEGDVQRIESFEAIRLPDEPPASPPPAPRVSTNQRKDDAFTGRSFAIVFDDVHLTPFAAHTAKLAVAEFLSKGLREGDRVLLTATGGGAWWSTRMMAGADELIPLLKRLDGRLIPDRSPDRISPHEAMRIWVYSDPLVENRVQRRFETYGAVPDRSRFESRGNNPFRTDSDGMLRARASEVYFQSAARMKITLGVMERMLQAFEGTKGRKSLVLVSDGFIHDPSIEQFKDVIRAARRSNVAIYFLDTKGLTGLPTHFGAEFGPPLDTQDIGAAFIEGFEAAAGSENLATDSGGFIVKNTNDLASGIQRIAAESQTYYLLGYNTTNTARDGKFRKIDVDVKRKGVKVRARKGYYAPLDGTATADKEDETIDPAFQRALDSPYELEDIPLRMTAYVFDETLLGKAKTLVTTEVDLAEFRFEEETVEGAPRFVNGVEFLLVVAHRDSGEYFRYDQIIDMKLLPETRERFRSEWLPIVRDFELEAGGYQAKILVRDRNSGRIGSVIHNFDVPRLDELRTSTPILSDKLDARGETSGASPRPVLLARREFSEGGTLYCQFEVYGARKEDATGMPRVTAGYEIRRREDGVVKLRVPPTPIRPTSLGALSRLVGAPLEDVPPGEYELVLQLEDQVAGRTLEVREPFTLSPASRGD